LNTIFLPGIFCRGPAPAKKEAVKQQSSCKRSKAAPVKKSEKTKNV
jgi:hypothetical protein